jgi:hypothetical protein
MYEQIVLSDLKAIEQLPDGVRNGIAAQVSKFINLANLTGSDALLEQFLSAAAQERHQAISDGASSVTDPRWAIAALKEAWCAAKLGKKRGVLAASAADAIVRGVEEFAFGRG